MKKDIIELSQLVLIYHLSDNRLKHLTL